MFNYRYIYLRTGLLKAMFSYMYIYLRRGLLKTMFSYRYIYEGGTAKGYVQL